MFRIGIASCWIYRYYHEISLFVPCNIICFEIYSLWYKCSSSGSLFISVIIVCLFSHLFVFNLYFPLPLKWVFYRQHILESFFICSNNFCLLNRTLKSFVFKVILIWLGLITVVLFISYLSHLFFALLFLLYACFGLVECFYDQYYILCSLINSSSVVFLKVINL